MGERYKINSVANAAALATQLSITLFVSSVAFWFDLGDTATAAVAQGIVGSLLFVVYACVWTGRRDLVSCAFRDHAPTKTLPEGASLFLTALNEVWNSWTTLICTIAYRVLTTILAAFVLCGPACRDRVWLFAPIWGVGFGVFYAANNAAWTELVPPDAVAQFMA